jgi:peptidoglycan/xylan/chitin deacetylase (PgdA/CDA1 family)
MVFITSSMSGCIFDSKKDFTDENSISNDCSQVNQSGVVLTFDDRKNLETWNASREMFKKYNVKATFFVDRWHTLNDSDINILRALTLEGHEIGFHTQNHADYFKYLENNSSAIAYYDHEILPGLEIMSQFGFYPTSFAYPNGHRDAEIDELLFSKFSVLRGTRSNANNSNHWMSSCLKYDVFRSYHLPHSDLNVGEYEDRNKTIQSKLEIMRTDESALLLLNGHGIAGGGYPVSNDYLSDLFKQLNQENIPTFLISELI